jgi:hypothetical protein
MKSFHGTNYFHKLRDTYTVYKAYWRDMYTTYRQNRHAQMQCTMGEISELKIAKHSWDEDHRIWWNMTETIHTEGTSIMKQNESAFIRTSCSSFTILISNFSSTLTSHRYLTSAEVSV